MQNNYFDSIQKPAAMRLQTHEKEFNLTLQQAQQLDDLLLLPLNEITFDKILERIQRAAMGSESGPSMAFKSGNSANVEELCQR
jgi:hypothetical protein